MAKKIVAQPQPRPQPQPQPQPVYCSKCNEQGIFCTCTPQLEVKRIKRGTFLFTFGNVGGAK